MSKAKSEVDINSDLSRYIGAGKESEKKYVSVLLPAGMYENIKLLAKAEGMGATTYIRERLIVPKLQEIANGLKADYDKSKEGGKC